MATSSIVMLSNISMERLYLSQPPAWNDLQRLPIGSTSFSSSQPTSQQDHRTSQQNLRTCYEKLLHHIYDMNSSTNNSTNQYHQLHEQLKLAAEFCQLQISSNKDTIHLYSEQFYIQVKFDSSTHMPSHISFGFTHDQSPQDESSSCPRMLRALNEKQYRLFRSHLNGYASLFSLTAPTMNNGKRVGFTAYNVLQQDVDRLAKTEFYGKLFEGFEPFVEGLPMRIRLNDHARTNASIPSHLRIVLQTSSNQHYLPMKSSIHLDEKTNQIHLDCSNIKANLLATGHFALEIEENQSPLFLLMSYAQDISRLTSFNHFLSNTKPSNYLLNVLPKTKLFNQYQWYISHDQSAVSIRQIPFTNVKQLVEILTYLRQQIHLTKSLHHYFHFDDEHERMDDDRHANENELFLELSLLSPTVLSMTCAQSSHLSTFVLQLNQIETFPLLIHRQQQREISLTSEKSSLWKSLEQMIDEENSNTDENSSMMDTFLNYSTTIKPSIKPSVQSTITSTIPKLNRRLSCGPPAKPTWRSATSLRRLQPACFTLISREEHTEKVDQENSADDSTHNTTNQSSINDEFHAQDNEEETDQNNMNDDDDDDDEIFISLTQQKSQQANVDHPPILPRPLSFHPSTLSRCTSVSSTQSVSTPPIFGLTPSTPYPGGTANQNENIFFPLAKQVSVPDFNPVSPTMSMGSFDPSAFLPANPVLASNTDPNIKSHVKKKRRRSDVSADDIIQSINANPNDNRSMSIAKMPSTAGAVGMNSGNGDPSNAKRGKKPMEKSGQSTPQQSQHQIVRQKSSFKVTDSPTAALLSQNQLNSPDETPGDFKPLKVVIKRVDGGNSSNDESQQSGGKPRKKIAAQQLANNAGAMPSVGRKMTSSSGGSSPSISIKSEAFDVPQINSDIPLTSMMSMNESGQSTNPSFERMKSMPSDYPSERPRPSSSLSNPSSSLASSSTSQPRSAPPPIVVKINRSKVLSAQDPPSSTSASATGTSTIGAGGTAMSSSSSTGGSSQNTIPATVKDALQKRNRPSSSGGNVSKTPVTSPPLLAAKLTSPLPGTTTNPLAAPNATVPPFRIPRKSSSQEVTAKPKIEPGTINNNVNSALNKNPLLPTPSGNNSSDSSKPINKSPVPSSNIRPPPPTAQIGSWQSPPTQQPPRFHQNRARASWTQPQPQPTRGRTPITPPNVATLSASGHPSSYAQYAQQPRSILKKPSGNDSLGPDVPFVPSSDLVAFHEQRGGANFSQTSSSSATASALLSRTVHSPNMYEDNDDDSSPQAQLVIDTSSSAANNALLPYTLVSGSNSASTIDSYDPTQENHSINSMGISSSSQQQQHYHDEHSSILD